MGVGIVWFRNDLRAHDHAPLATAMAAHDRVLGVYVWSARLAGKLPSGFDKVGPHRRTFLAESLRDLGHSLAKRGVPLLVLKGEPAEAMSQVIHAGDTVYCTGDPAPEERLESDAVKQTCQNMAAEFRAFPGHTLLHPSDLPFAMNRVPDLFTTFRKDVERQWRVRDEAPPPSQTLDRIDAEVTLPNDLLAQGQPLVKGGETAGLERLQNYFFESKSVRVYKETRNGMLALDDSSKLSPYLAHGCLSPRRVYFALRRFEASFGANDSTYWLLFELLWRDFFAFQLRKHGARMFFREGIDRVRIHWRTNRQWLQTWINGQTGFPIVDASMRELAATGFTSNRARQNVASFFCKNLGLDWRLGAEYYESMLIDYDVASNWGNWQYQAGVGNDAREFRLFNLVKQSIQYDPQGDYLAQWVPELRNLPAGSRHNPGPMERQLVGYPAPIVDFDESARQMRKAFERARRD